MLRYRVKNERERERASTGGIMNDTPLASGNTKAGMYRRNLVLEHLLVGKPSPINGKLGFQLPQTNEHYPFS